MQTYKQKAERPDLMVICLCPGWVKTGACLPFALHVGGLLTSERRYGRGRRAANSDGERYGRSESHHIAQARRQRSARQLETRNCTLVMGSCTAPRNPVDT